jgi:hypothetical protein
MDVLRGDIRDIELPVDETMTPGLLYEASENRKAQVYRRGTKSATGLELPLGIPSPLHFPPITGDEFVAGGKSGAEKTIGCSQAIWRLHEPGEIIERRRVMAHRRRILTGEVGTEEPLD